MLACGSGTLPSKAAPGIERILLIRCLFLTPLLVFLSVGETATEP
jgi:hypothetical protein